MIQLGDKEIHKLSEITGVSHFDLQKLYTMGILHEAHTLEHLLRHEYAKLSRMGKYRPGHIITALSAKYDVSTNKVRSAIYHKRSRYYYCQQCSKRIVKSMFVRNDGLCDSCVIKSIDI